MNTDEWTQYARLTAELIDLPIPETSLAGIVDTLTTTAKVAQPLLDFELPEGTEMGPTFTS